MGVSHPSWKHGRYSRHLPARLAARLAEADANVDPMGLASEAALVETAIADTLDAISESEANGEATGDLRRELIELIGLRGKLAAISARCYRAREGVIPLGQVQTLLAALTAAIQVHVTDKATLGMIQGEFQALLSRTALPAAHVIEADDFEGGPVN